MTAQRKFAAKLAAMIDSPGGVDFYNHFMGDANSTGKKRLLELQALLQWAAKK